MSSDPAAPVYFQITRVVLSYCPKLRPYGARSRPSPIRLGTKIASESSIRTQKLVVNEIELMHTKDCHLCEQASEMMNDLGLEFKAIDIASAPS